MDAAGRLPHLGNPCCAAVCERDKAALGPGLLPAPGEGAHLFHTLLPKGRAVVGHPQTDGTLLTASSPAQDFGLFLNPYTRSNKSPSPTPTCPHHTLQVRGTSLSPLSQGSLPTPGETCSFLLSLPDMGAGVFHCSEKESV